MLLIKGSLEQLVQEILKLIKPQGGRTKGKALKVGEMEKDAFVAHGASSVIEERMMKSSDEFKLIVCRNCGSIVDDKNAEFVIIHNQEYC